MNYRFSLTHLIPLLISKHIIELILTARINSSLIQQLSELIEKQFSLEKRKRSSDEFLDDSDQSYLMPTRNWEPYSHFALDVHICKRSEGHNYFISKNRSKTVTFLRQSWNLSLKTKINNLLPPNFYYLVV